MHIFQHVVDFEIKYYSVIDCTKASVDALGPSTNSSKGQIINQTVKMVSVKLDRDKEVALGCTGGKEGA